MEIKINKRMFDKFMDLSCQLSPENLCCDGEASEAQINRTIREIKKQWKELESKIGRKVTQDEIWQSYFSKKLV